MTRTYIDSGVLIAAARGSGTIGERALAVISDSGSREFVASDYVRIETVPKPIFYGRAAEVQFYEEFFATVATWVEFDTAHLKNAFEEACRAGLSWVDAVHVVVAELSGCEELVTTEKPTAAIHRTGRIRIVSLDE